MNFKYITLNDLKAGSQERFIDESSADFEESPAIIEETVIGIVSTMIGDRYDCVKIFDATTPLRNALLVDIIVKMVLFRLFKRNGTRRIGGGSKEDNEWALTQLEKIGNGRPPLYGLPKTVLEPIEDNGDTGGVSLWGNFSDPNFYI